MDNDEEEEEHGGAGKPQAVVRELDVLLPKDGEDDLLHERQHHVNERAEPAPELPLALHPKLVAGALVRFRLLLLEQRGRRAATGRRGFAPASCPKGADDGVGRVLFNDVGGVNHVELFARVLSSEGQDRQLAARAVLQEVRDVQDLSVQCNPAIPFGGVLRDLLHRVARATASRRRGRTCPLVPLVHVVLVRAAGELGSRYLTREAAAREVLEGGWLHVRAHHVLSAVLAADAAEDHAVEERVPPKAVVPMDATRHLPGGVEPWDGLPATSPVRPPPERSLREVGFTSAPIMYLAQCLPLTRPKTTQSRREFPPRRLFPWTPPATSPAA